MKKIILAICIVCGCIMGLSAQGYPVMDISNIIASIENGYTMIQQLEAMYNNVKTAYDQLQQQIKNFESFDISQLDARDPLGSWRAMMTYADRMMTYEQNIEKLLNNKNLKIGNESWSLNDIFTSNPIDTAVGMASSGIGFVAVDPFERKLTPQEKAVFHQKYGMGFGHYMRYNYMGEALQQKAAEIAAYSTGLQDNLQEDRQRLDSIIESGFDNESAIKQQQTANALLASQAQEAKTQSNLLGQIGTLMAMEAVRNQEMRKAAQEIRNTSNFDFAEGFVNMINDQEASSNFK